VLALENPHHFIVSGRRNLPNTSKLQVAEGREDPEALVATTYHVCAQGEIASVAVVSVVVTTGESSRYKT
jgi:hypothetical protein